MSKPVRTPALGSFLHVVYLDHTSFRNADPDLPRPLVIEAYGILDKEEDNHWRLVVARYEEPCPDGSSKPKISGHVILRAAILTCEELALPTSPSSEGSL